ncbi:hypothetical protein LINGRAHAP2_LOCUS14343 [Linum grandiflorum]
MVFNRQLRTGRWLQDALRIAIRRLQQLMCQNPKAIGLVVQKIHENLKRFGLLNTLIPSNQKSYDR